VCGCESSLPVSCTAWFTVEVILRFVACPSKLGFWRDFKNIVDVVAIVPYYVTLFNVLSTMSCTGAKSGSPSYGYLPGRTASRRAAPAPSRARRSRSSASSVSFASSSSPNTRSDSRSFCSRSAPVWKVSACSSSLCSSAFSKWRSSAVLDFLKFEF